MAITAAALQVEVTANTSRARQELSNFGRSLQGTMSQGVGHVRDFSNAIEQVGPRIVGMGVALGGLAAVRILTPITRAVMGIGQEALGAYMETERLTLSLQSMSAMELVNTGAATDFGSAMAQSGERAQELLEWMRQLAIESPFSVQDVAPMMRLGMVFGFNSEQAKRLTEATMNMSAALGFSGPDMERVIRALGQMNTKGKVTNEELMQMAEIGVPGLRILADAAGVSTAEMQQLISKGLVPAGPAIETIVRGFEKYEGTSTASAGTMMGLIASFQDLKSIWEVDFFSPVFKTAQESINKIVVDLQDPRVREALKSWGEDLGESVSTGLSAVETKVLDIIDSWTQLESLEMPEMPSWVQAGAAVFGGRVDVENKGMNEEGVIDVDARVVTIDWTDPTGAGLKTSFDAEAQVTKIDQTSVTSGGNKFTKGLVFDATGKITHVDWNKGANKDGSSSFMFSYDVQADVKKIVWGDETNPEAMTYTYNATTDITKVTYKGREFVEEGDAGQIFALRAVFEVGRQSLRDAILRAFGADPVLIDAQFNARPSGNYVDPESQPWSDDLSGQFPRLESSLETSMRVVIDTNADTLTAMGFHLTENSATAPDASMVVIPQTDTSVIQAQLDRGKYWLHFTPIIDQAPSLYRQGERQAYARGTKFHPGGMAIVGEEGPELVNLPRGSSVLTARQTRALLSRYPGYAEGVGGEPAPWVPLPASFGDTTGMFTAAIDAAAKKISGAGSDFKSEIRQAISEFSGQLQGVPGLFGTSPVTTEQMDDAKLGIPQNFADDYVRRLTDEVMNGVDWEGVDMADAAQRAGIDPSLPVQAQLKLFSKAWQDQSLFADPKNLDLINMDAVKAQLLQTQAAESGSENIMALFGIGDEALVASIGSLGLQVQSGLSEWLTQNGMENVGAQLAAGLGTGVGGTTAVGEGAGASVTTWTSSDDAEKVYAAAGTAIGDGISRHTVVVPTVQTPNATDAVLDDAVPDPVGGEGRPKPQAQSSINIAGSSGSGLVKAASQMLARAEQTVAAASARPVEVNVTVNKPYEVELLVRRLERMMRA